MSCNNCHKQVETKHIRPIKAFNNIIIDLQWLCKSCANKYDAKEKAMREYEEPGIKSGELIRLGSGVVVIKELYEAKDINFFSKEPDVPRGTFKIKKRKG